MKVLASRRGCRLTGEDMPFQVFVPSERLTAVRTENHLGGVDATRTAGKSEDWEVDR